jgi:hypothetical protein
VLTLRERVLAIRIPLLALEHWCNQLSISLQWLAEPERDVVSTPLELWLLAAGLWSLLQIGRKTVCI